MAVNYVTILLILLKQICLFIFYLNSDDLNRTHTSDQVSDPFSQNLML